MESTSIFKRCSLCRFRSWPQKVLRFFQYAPSSIFNYFVSQSNCSAVGGIAAQRSWTAKLVDTVQLRSWTSKSIDIIARCSPHRTLLLSAYRYDDADSTSEATATWRNSRLRYLRAERTKSARITPLLLWVHRHVTKRGRSHVPARIIRILSWKKQDLFPKLAITWRTSKTIEWTAKAWSFFLQNMA